MCMFVQWVGIDNRPLSPCILFFSCGLTQTFVRTHSHSCTRTHTPRLHTQFLLASVKLQQFRDSKTGTIWSSLPASHFLPSPLRCFDRVTETNRWIKGKNKVLGWMERKLRRGWHESKRVRVAEADVDCTLSVCGSCKEDVAWDHGKAVESRSWKVQWAGVNRWNLL